ncbi:MAG TPA: toll/interleukin-1 receptor domain-containing protein [Bryobacteraceae bacterium]
MLLQWFFNTRRAQIKRLRSEGLNALATVEEEKLRPLSGLRKYQSYNGTVLRPGDRFFCDDRDHPGWDCTGDVLAYDDQDGSYTVRFDGPDGYRGNPPERLTADQVEPVSEVGDQQKKNAEKWTNSPLVRLLDLAPVVKTALENRLSVFLCHASEDKARVRDLYTKLKLDGFYPWLDIESLAPGDEWEDRIRRDIQRSDIVLACLSAVSIAKAGFIQAEMDFAWDAAHQRADGELYLIPVLLESCGIPARLAAWHAVRLFEADGYGKLVSALRDRARVLGRVTD